MTTTTYAPRPLSLIPGHRDNAKSRTTWCPQDGRDREQMTHDGMPVCRHCGAKAPALPLEGAFLATSWGYDQTNVEFYRVMGTTKSGKSVRLQQWKALRVDRDGGPSADYLIPGDGPAQEPVYGPSYADEDGWMQRGDIIGWKDVPAFTHRARFHGGASTTVLGHYAKVWDGTPQYASTTGWGH